MAFFFWPRAQRVVQKKGGQVSSKKKALREIFS